MPPKKADKAPIRQPTVENDSPAGSVAGPSGEGDEEGQEIAMREPTNRPFAI